MTEEQKAKYFKIAASMAYIHINEKTSALFVALYELMMEKEGGASISDVSKIAADINAKYPDKKESE